MKLLGSNANMAGSPDEQLDQLTIELEEAEGPTEAGYVILGWYADLKQSIDPYYRNTASEE